MRSLITLFALTLTLRADVPGWFREAATATHPTYPPQIKGVALFSEESVTVEASGKRISTIRKAIKILNREGKQEAGGGVTYDSKGSKVKDFKAWLIYPGGKQKEYGKRDFVEGSSKPSYALYSTQRFYSISGAADADPGAVFGYEATVEEDSVFSQFIWAFQDDLPHLLSRFQLTVPAGWKAEAKAYEGAVAEPTVNGNTYTWEARKLAPVEREPGSPRMISMLPRIAVSMIPPEGTPLGAGPLVCFRTWKDVSAWESKLIEPQAQVTAAIEAKVAELTAGKTSQMAKIQALGEYVQQIRYVSIQIHLARGGGYVPNKVDEILRLAYGDCKDKANLLQTMLKTIGVESYHVGIYAGDPRFAEADFASPFQFNHAILAIRVDDSVKLPAVATYPDLGRILFFDPTDTYVAFGYMPGHEQNANALITAGERGQLVKTPATKPEENHTTRTWTLKLEADGSFSGQMVEVSTGQAAFDDRAELESLSKDQYRKAIESSVARMVTGVEIDSISTAYNANQQQFRLDLRFHAPSYAKVMQGRLWMVRSMPTSFSQVPNVSKAERERPLVLKPVSFSEEVHWTLPDSLKLDELPDGGAMQAGFGKWDASWKQNGLEVEAKRSLLIQPAVVPVAEYKRAREFLMRFHGAGEAAMVLLKK